MPGRKHNLTVENDAIQNERNDDSNLYHGLGYDWYPYRSAVGDNGYRRACRHNKRED